MALPIETALPLYGRRQFVAAVAAISLVVSGYAGATAGLRVLVSGPGGGPLTASATAPPGGPSPRSMARAATSTVHVVQPGDTLWSIARSLDRRFEPVEDLRTTVDRLAALNGGAALEVGQRVVLS